MNTSHNPGSSSSFQCRSFAPSGVMRLSPATDTVDQPVLAEPADAFVPFVSFVFGIAFSVISVLSV